MNYEKVVEEKSNKWSFPAVNVAEKDCAGHNTAGFRSVQHKANIVGSAGVSMQSLTPYSNFAQQQQRSSSSSPFRPPGLSSLSQQKQQQEKEQQRSSELLNSGGDSSLTSTAAVQHATQQQNDAAQKLLAHLNSALNSSQVGSLVTSQQFYMAAAAAEEAKLLETRKQQLIQDWQQQMSSSSKLPANGTNAAAAQLWLDHKPELAQWMERQQLQQQQNPVQNANSSQQPSGLLPHHSTTAHLLPGSRVQQQQIAALQQAVQQHQQQLQQVVQNGELQRKIQNEQQQNMDSESKLAEVHNQHILPSSQVVHVSGGPTSAFRQTQQRQFMLDQIAKRSDDFATVSVNPGTDISGTLEFTTLPPSSSNSSSFVAPLSRNHRGTSVGKETMSSLSEKKDDLITEPKLVIEMNDETNNKVPVVPESHPISSAEESGDLLASNSSGGIVGLSTNATVDAVIHVDNDGTVKTMKNDDEQQPRLKSILDFVDGEMEMDMEQTGADTAGNDDKRLVDDDKVKSNVVNDRENRLPLNNTESSEMLVPRTVTPMEQTRFAAMRIEERILNEKLSLPTTSTVATSSSIISSISSPQRSTPQSVPPAPSPRSDSVPSTPSSSTFCRAPGLGPVTVSETQCGTQLPLVCNICGFSCNSKFHYNSHMNTHGDHQCTMCDYTSRTEGRLKKHMRDSHTVEEQLAAGLDVEQASTSGTSASGTPTTRLTATPIDGSNLSTSIASVLEAANIAAAAQAAATTTNCSSGSSSGPITSAPSDSGSGLSLPSGSGTPPPSDMVSSSSSCGAGPSTSGLAPSALDQIRAFTENPSVLPDLSSANLATALISQGLLGSHTLQESMKSISSNDEPSSSSFSGDKSRQCSSKPKTYKCKQCNHISASKEEQWTHARTHIPVEKQLGCTRCGFVTEYKHHLEYHLRNHMGSKPFHCKKCAYSCVNKSMLNSHMKSHTNIYQFRCRDCTYATKYCHSLKLHLRKYNHNRATDVPDSTSNVASTAVTAGSSDLCNGSLQGSAESRDVTMLRLNESFVSQAVDGTSPEPLPSASTMAQEITAALGMAPMVTSSSLNLASHLLFRPHHQMEEIELLLRLKNMTGLNPGAILGVPLQCPVCSYHGVNQEDSLRHQLNHLIGPNDENPLTSFYNSFNLPTAASLSGRTALELDSNTKDEMNEQLREPDEETEISQIGTNDGMIGGEGKSTCYNLTDSEDHMMSDTSGESQDSPASGKSSDEGSYSTEHGSDRGAKKRKAGFKLDQIAARLHEKNSPENSDISDTVNETKCGFSISGLKEETMMSSGMSENPLSMTSSSREAPSVASLPPATAPLQPQPRVIPPLGMHSNLASLSNLNIFQQACIAHMQDMERKLNALEIWRFSCVHCKMAFQDEPLYHIHMGYHGYENPFKCNRCGQACSDFLTFNLHLLQAKH